MIPLANARFWRKVDKNGPIPAHRPELGPCWIWKGHLTYHGYGRVCKGTPAKRYQAHVVAFVTLRGPIPAGLEPDHLCFIRKCVNPWHIEPVTHKVNSLRGNSPLAQNARKTYCKRGHPFNEQNTRRSSGGGRVCRICSQMLKKEWRRKRREAGLCVT